MISFLKHSSERFCVSLKNGLHLIIKSCLQGIHEINSLSFNIVMVKVILWASFMLMAS